MSRPKKGTPEGEAATKRMREACIRRYGSEKAWKEHLSTIGRKGGQNGKGPDYRGGFASCHALAVKAGRKGGYISSRQLEDKPSLEDRRKWYYGDIAEGILSE